MRSRRLCVAIVTLLCTLALNLSGPGATAEAAGAVATLTAGVGGAGGGQAGLTVGLSGGTPVTGFRFGLTAGSPSSVQILPGVSCPSPFAACTSQIDGAADSVTVQVAGAGSAATPLDLAFVPLRVTSPVTALTTVTLTFQQLTGQTGAATPLPAPVTVVLQRGAVLNVGSRPPSAPRTLSHQDVTSALEYLVGSLPAGAGQGQVNPVNLASLVPDGASAPDVPGPANAVALLQYLAGQRGPDLGPATVSVTAAASNPTTAGFTLTLSPAVPGLTVGDISLSGAQVQSLTTADGGATYAVLASLAQGQSYTLTVSAPGYTFGAPLPVAVPQAVATAVHASVSGVSTAGFTLDLSPPVPGLVAGDLGLVEAQSVTTADGGATYAVAASLAPGQSYTLALVVAGYSFGAPLTVAVPQTVATSVYASVYGVSAGGFTLDLSPAVDGLVPGDLSLSGGASVNSLSTSSHGASYDVGAALVAGANYTLTISAAGYSFGAPLVVGVPGPTVATAVYASVYGVSTGGFVLGLSPPVPGLTAGDLGLSGAEVRSLTMADGGAIYTVAVSLAAGQSYTLTISATGYSFGAPLTVALPQTVATAVYASISGISVNGFMLDLSPPVPNLQPGNLSLSGGAEVTSLAPSDDGATYGVTASLTAGRSYALAINADGYTFGSPMTIAVPLQTVIASVYGVSPTGFTLSVSPAVPGLTVALSGATVPATTPDSGATYVVAAPLTVGQSYPLTLSAPGYTFTAPATVTVPTPVMASVSGVSATGFTLSLSPAVPGLTVALSGATVPATTPDSGATYVVAAPLTVGQSYPLTLSAPGYTFTAPATVTVPTPVMASVSGVSATGFTLGLSPPVPGLTAGALSLPGVQVQILTIRDGGATYAVTASLAAGRNYSLTLAAAGYTFTGAASVTVPAAAPQSVSASVYNPYSPSTNEFTLLLGQAVPNLSVSLVGGPAVQVSTTDNVTYTVTVQVGLTSGQTYPLTLAAAGYTFPGAPSVTVPITVVPSVTAPSETQFDLRLTPDVPTLATAGTLSLFNVVNGQTQTPVTATLGQSSDGGHTYPVYAQLTGGQSYSLTVSSAVYYFGSALTVAVPITVVAAVYNPIYNPTLTELPVSLSQSVDLLHSTTATLTDNSTGSSIPISLAGSGTNYIASTVVGTTLSLADAYTLTIQKAGYSFVGLTPIVGASTNSQGTDIILDFGTAMAAPSAGVAGFTVRANGSNDPVTSVSLSSDPTQLDLALAFPVYQDPVTISYTGSAGVETSDGTAWPALANVVVRTLYDQDNVQALASSYLSRYQSGAWPVSFVAGNIAYAINAYNPPAPQLTAIALKTVYSQTYTQVAGDLLNGVGSGVNGQNLALALPVAFPVSEMTQSEYVGLLAGSPYALSAYDLGAGLKAAYGDTDVQATSLLEPYFGIRDVADMLGPVSQLGIFGDNEYQVASALSQAGYATNDISSTLTLIYGSALPQVVLDRLLGESWTSIFSAQFSTPPAGATSPTLFPFVQAVLAAGFSPADAASALEQLNTAVVPTGVVLLDAGVAPGDVAKAIVSAFGAAADESSVAQAISSLETSAASLAADLEGTGFSQLTPLAEALFAVGFTAPQAAGALDTYFSGSQGQIGPALTGAGYDIHSAVSAMMSLDGGHDALAVVAAWPSLFGPVTLAPASTAAANLQAAGYPAVGASDLLQVVYPALAQNQTLLAAAMFGPYGPVNTAYALQAWYDALGEGAAAAQGTADALYPQYAASCSAAQLPTCLGGLVGIVHNVFGDGAVQMLNILQDAVIKASDPITVLAQAVCTGNCYSANDVAGAALQAEGFQTALAASVLHEAGYTAAQVATALQPTLGDSGFTVSGVTTVLSGGATANADKYTAADIAGVLMSDFSATAATTAAALLAPNLPYSLADVATALQTVYGIDGAGFVQILEGLYTNTQLLAMLPNTAGCSFSVVCVLQSQTGYGLSAAEAAAALHSAGTLADGTLPAAALDVLSGYSLGPTSPATSATPLNTQASTLIQAGYSVTEVVSIFDGEGEGVSTALSALHGAGAGITATDEAAYLKSSNNETDSGTAGTLQQAGYSLNDIVTALISVYNDVSDLDTILPALRYNPTVVDSTIASVSPDPALDVALAMAGVHDPTTQVVSALQDIFPTLDATAIAATLGTSGANYAAAAALGALRAEAGLTAGEAETLLQPDFNVTGITAVAAALVGANYSPAEVAGALGSTNPVDISTALAAANVPADYIQSALVNAFGQSGSLHDPLALADDLKALGFDPIAAGRALQALGSDPAHVGALLFVNGYSLADVATGILDTLPASTATSGSWDHAVMGALRQIPTISGAGGFTTTDAAQALQALIGTCDSSCIAEIGRAMFSAGYSASDVAGVLYSTYHEPLSQTYFDEPVGGLGYDLQVAGFTSVQVAQAEQAAPIGATDVQIAGSLLATTFNDGDCYTALTAVDVATSDPEESALAAMTQAGFGALRVGTVLDLLLQGQPLLVYQDLYYLGYGLSDVELVQFKLFPFNEQAFVNALGAAVPENDAGGGQGAGVLGGVFVKGLGSI